MGFSETLILWLGHTEPVWLLLILLIEMAACLYSAIILTIEFRYDKWWNERRRARIQPRKRMDFEVLTIGEGK